MDLDRKAVGARIRQAREASERTQMDLAVAIGRRPEQVSRWERGDQLPSADILGDMGEVLGVTIDWLVRGEVPPPSAEADAPNEAA